ncbi:MAG TPA: 23S rRNA (pseudouridine(1915)-N(3))-methyltransferase RlmH [Casimicrobiaceae bacterium]|nr:23S rRNA (pseudouridine(1915)-N(3))-methyltransferase RlmH [Casimicrobiaceae bacterium]
MRLRLVALGHRMPGWVAEGYADYAKRLLRDFALDLVELKPEPRDRGKSTEQMLVAEAARIRAACAGFRVVALDERGTAWTTRELAARLARWRDEARDVAFVIGSADGLDASVKRDADDVVSLSALTLPHALVRVLLAEQLYRAAALNAGHPYHRE